MSAGAMSSLAHYGINTQHIAGNIELKCLFSEEKKIIISCHFFPWKIFVFFFLCKNNCKMKWCVFPISPTFIITLEMGSGSTITFSPRFKPLTQMELIQLQQKIRQVSSLTNFLTGHNTDKLQQAPSFNGSRLRTTNGTVHIINRNPSFLIGWLYDYTQTYTGSYYFSGACYLLSSVSLFFVPLAERWKNSVTTKREDCSQVRA